MAPDPVASPRIIDGEIGCSGVDVDKLTERGVRFADETEIHADVLIQATCFRAMHAAIAQIVSREIGDRDGCPWAGNK
jgi:putative flavoprotein involved in K+ transport